MSLFEQIPNTKQGLITFRTYAENQLKSLNLSIKQMHKIMAEVERRLEEMKGKEKSA